MKLHFCITLLAVLVLAVACGSGASKPAATSTPYHLRGTPDASGVIRAAAPRLVAADAGRADCPQGWFVFDDEAYSICYPADHYAEVWSSASFPEQRFTVRLVLGEPVAETPNTLTIWQRGTYNPPTDCYFDGEETAVPDKRQMGIFSLGHTTVEGCLAELGGITQYRGVIGTDVGEVRYQSEAASDEQFSLAKQILATLVVNDLCPKYPKCATMRAQSRITPTPTSTPLIPAPDARLCRGADIATNVGGQGYSGGGVLTYIALRNVSDSPCQITKAPDVQFLDANGNVLPVDLLGRASIQGEPWLLKPHVDFDPTGLRAGQVALSLDWHSYLASATGSCATVQPHATQLRLLLAGSDEVIVDLMVAPCGGSVSYRSYGPGYRE